MIALQPVRDGLEWNGWNDVQKKDENRETRFTSSVSASQYFFFFYIIACIVKLLLLFRFGLRFGTLEYTTPTLIYLDKY